MRKLQLTAGLELHAQFAHPNALQQRQLHLPLGAEVPKACHSAGESDASMSTSRSSGSSKRCVHLRRAWLQACTVAVDSGSETSAADITLRVRFGPTPFAGKTSSWYCG